MLQRFKYDYQKITLALSHFKNQRFQDSFQRIYKRDQRIMQLDRLSIRSTKPYTEALFIIRYVPFQRVVERTKSCHFLTVIQMEKLRALLYLVPVQPYPMSIQNDVNFDHVDSEHVDFDACRLPACQLRLMSIPTLIDSVCKFLHLPFRQCGTSGTISFKNFLYCYLHTT